MLYYAFLNGLVVIILANQKSAIFVTIDIFWIKPLNFNQMSAIDVMIYWWCLLALAILPFWTLKILIIAV